MSDVVYVSNVKIVRQSGPVRVARLPGEPQPVIFSVHGAIAEAGAEAQTRMARTAVLEQDGGHPYAVHYSLDPARLKSHTLRRSIT